MSDGSNVSVSENSTVTFVGGKAIEQHMDAESNVEPDVREDALAAVREAIQKAGKDSAEDAASSKGKDPFKPSGERIEVERGPDGKFVAKDADTKEDIKPKEPKAEKETPEEDTESLDVQKATVKQLLKAREKVAAMKREAKDEISQERRRFQEEAKQLNDAWQQLQHQQRQLQQERQRVDMIKSDPARAVREIGLDPEKFILDLAQEGTPEGQAKRQYQALQDQIAEMKAWKEEQAQMVAHQHQLRQQQHIQNIRQTAVNDFLTLGLNEEKYPHVSNFYKGSEKALVALGDIYAEEFRALSGGREGSFDQILDYIEDELADKANSWYTKKGKVSQGNTGSQKAQTTAQSGKGSKGKSLNPEVSGERRTLQQKDLRDLDADERIETAKQAVAVALAASKARSAD